MNRLIMAGVMAALLPPHMASAARPACQTGVASAPFIGRSDMRAIMRSATALPSSRGPRAALNVGSVVSGRVTLAPLPKAVIHVLPQYRHYHAFRDAGYLAIVDPRSRRLAYLLPLEVTAAQTHCP